jgi:hypothetical protein
MLALKLGRHFKGAFRLTPFGKTLAGHPCRVFGLVAPFYLFRVDHARHVRVQAERLYGNWDIFLNAINREAKDSISAERLREALYGPPEPGNHYDPIGGKLHTEVLRPLCWLGLLEIIGEERIPLGRSSFAKTRLWHAALRLDTDELQPVEGSRLLSN